MTWISGKRFHVIVAPSYGVFSLIHENCMTIVADGKCDLVHGF
ncbi:hypothetical protein ACXA45_00565 [Neomicrococcus lactis]|uniref:Uncharacterized protein n=1 Tax=Neomicrococcus lactis TaxID=732241 RepID=A0A7W9DA86_9MICC|nr:hypothetical protein [Neomicrococcus lactis]MBB5597378.1 hypothetical protein [Neomicrococcus lactis]